MTRPGFALVVALLIAITLSLIGLGALAVGLRESAIAGSLEHRERARLRAEAGALAVIDAWSTRTHADLRIGQSRTIADSDRGTTVFRVDSALFLVQAEWEDDAGPGAPVGRAGVLVRTYPLHRVTDYVPAAVTIETGGTLGDRAVVAAHSCVGTPALIGPAEVEGASIDGEIVSTGPDDSVDPLPAELLAVLADIRLEAGHVRPRPLALGGECLPGPTNWGAGPGHPCHGLLPIVHAEGPLTVDGGSGWGIIVVDGDLVLDSGFHFHGILLVRGELTIRGGATVEGAVRATSMRFEDGRVARVPCDLDPVVAGPALDRAFRPPSRWWVPVF